MIVSLPFDYSLCQRGGGFITPYRSVIPAYGKHEDAARNYCTGEIVEKPESGLELFPKRILFRESQLTEKQYQDLLLWKRLKGNNYDTFWSDFMVFCLGFDKAGYSIEKIPKLDDTFDYLKIDTITTTAPHPHIRFFNYYLMDWRIDILAKEVYNPETDQFEVDQDNSYLEDYADMEAAQEIEEVKQYVKRKEDRPMFFK
jgi:hypothetical protein